MDPTAQPNERIIAKLQKILALRDRAGTEGEAAAAATTAQELMSAYNLTMAEIDSHTASAEGDRKRMKDTYTRSAMFAWQRTLWRAVAEANYCWYEARKISEWKNGRDHFKTYHHIFIGREANVISTRAMGDYLEEAVNRLCPYKPGGDSAKSQTSWKEGCVARLAERLVEKRATLEREDAERREAAAGQNVSTAITLRSVAQYEDDENFRIKWGEGAYLRRLAQRHDWETCACRFCTERREFNDRWAKRDVIAKIEEKPETEAQRRKRIAREEAQQQRWEKNYYARAAREARRLDQHAYREGEAAGANIGLDSQLKTGRDSKRLGE